MEVGCTHASGRVVEFNDQYLWISMISELSSFHSFTSFTSFHNHGFIASMSHCGDRCERFETVRYFVSFHPSSVRILNSDCFLGHLMILKLRNAEDGLCCFVGWDHQSQGGFLSERSEQATLRMKFVCCLWGQASHSPFAQWNAWNLNLRCWNWMMIYIITKVCGGVKWCENLVSFALRPRPTSPDANTKYMASSALAPSSKQASETLGFKIGMWEIPNKRIHHWKRYIRQVIHCVRVGGCYIAPADEDELRRHFPDVITTRPQTNSSAQTKTKTHHPQTNSLAQTNSPAKTKTKTHRPQTNSQPQTNSPAKTKTKTHRLQTNSQPQTNSPAKTKTKTHRPQTNSQPQTNSLAKTEDEDTSSADEFPAADEFPSEDGRRRHIPGTGKRLETQEDRIRKEQAPNGKKEVWDERSPSTERTHPKPKKEIWIGRRPDTERTDPKRKERDLKRKKFGYGKNTSETKKEIRNVRRPDTERTDPKRKERDLKRKKTGYGKNRLQTERKRFETKEALIRKEHIRKNKKKIWNGRRPDTERTGSKRKERELKRKKTGYGKNRPEKERKRLETEEDRIRKEQAPNGKKEVWDERSPDTERTHPKEQKRDLKRKKTWYGKNRPEKERKRLETEKDRIRKEQAPNEKKEVWDERSPDTERTHPKKNKKEIWNGRRPDTERTDPKRKERDLKRKKTGYGKNRLQTERKRFETKESLIRKEHIRKNKKEIWNGRRPDTERTDPKRKERDWNSKGLPPSLLLPFLPFRRACVSFVGFPQSPRPILYKQSLFFISYHQFSARRGKE